MPNITVRATAEGLPKTTTTRPKVAHPIEALPFIGRREKKEYGRFPRHYWRVQPSGDYSRDCYTGRGHALEYLSYEEADRLMPGGGCTILGLIVADMPRDHTGVEVAFLQMVAFAAVHGAAKARRISAYWDECNAKKAVKHEHHPSHFPA